MVQTYEDLGPSTEECKESRVYMRELRIAIYETCLMNFQGCGDLRYVDIEESIPGGAAELQREIEVAVRAVSDGNQAQGSFCPLATLPRAHLPSNHGHDHFPRLPTLHSPGSGDPSSFIATQTTGDSMATITDTEPKYLLVCVNTKRSIIKVAHIEVASLTNDQLLFREVQRAYSEIRQNCEWSLGSIFSKRIRIPDWFLKRLSMALPRYLEPPGRLMRYLEDCKMFIPNKVEFVQVCIYQ